MTRATRKTAENLTPGNIVIIVPLFEGLLELLEVHWSNLGLYQRMHYGTRPY